MQSGPESVPTDEVSAFVERWRPGGGGERSNYQIFPAFPRKRRSAVDNG